MNPKRIFKPGSVAAPSKVGHPGTDEADEKVQPFPLHHLPPTAQAMAEATARTERTPETLAGGCVLSILSASIGAGLQVESGSNRVTRANLYILLSAESGSGKSETYRHVVKPFMDFEQQIVDRWKANTLPGLQAEADILESEIAKLKRGAFNCKSSVERAEIYDALKAKKKALAEIGAGLNAPRLCCEDVTSEKLAVMLGHNQEQLASLSSDAGAVVNILLGCYNKADRTDESVYLKAFSGDNCRVDRQTREPVLLDHPCLVVLWLTQPDKLESLMAARSLTDGGLIPRLLACHTRAQPQPIVDDVEGIPTATARDWARLINELVETFHMASKPLTIQPTPEALRILNEHYNQIVIRRRGELKDVTIYAARWNEQAWRIAVCLHAGMHGKNAGELMLDANTAESAIALADWFTVEQLRILARGRHAAHRAKQDEVLSLLAETPQGIRASDVYRKRIVPTAEDAHALLAKLEAEGELQGRDDQPVGGGHVTRIYTKAGM
jgi:hypothetical protein